MQLKKQVINDPYHKKISMKIIRVKHIFTEFKSYEGATFKHKINPNIIYEFIRHIKQHYSFHRRNRAI